MWQVRLSEQRLALPSMMLWGKKLRKSHSGLSMVVGFYASVELCCLIQLEVDTEN